MASVSDSVDLSTSAAGTFADDFRRQAEALLAADLCTQAELEKARQVERDDYLFTLKIAHRYEAGELEKLLEEVTTTDFLAAQADYSRGFQPGSRDFESFVLPAAIECAENDSGEGWLRFLHLALLAANFRGLADALAEEEILEALVRHGQRRLAVDVAAQLADPAARAQARSVIVAAVPGEPNEGELLGQIEEDLDALPATGDEATAAVRLATLRSVATRLGPRLRSRWPGWIESLGSNGDKVWQAVAESWIRQGGWAEPGLLEALVAIGDRERLLPLLAPRFAASAGAEVFLLPLADSSLNDPRLEAGLRLARIAERLRDRDETVVADEAAVANGQRLVRRPLPWNVGLVELGAPLWPHLGGRRVTELADSIEDWETKTALLVTGLEQASEFLAPRHVLEAAGAIDDGPARLHWSLRALAALPEASSKETARWLAGVAHFLHRTRYQAPPQDLARFLDLVARHLTSDLAAQTENVVWASDPASLLDLVSAASTHELLEQILRRAEAFAAAVSRHESEGFELRRQLLILLGCCYARRFRDAQRLKKQAGSLPPGMEAAAVEGIWKAAESLLPGEEEDELRVAVIRELLEEPVEPDQVAACRELARQVFDGLESPRLKLLMGLRIEDDPEQLAQQVRPAALYAGVATTAALEDELNALSALFQTPEHPRDLARTYLAQVQDPERRVLGLVDLARHALAHQRTRYRPTLRDRTAALQPLKEALGGMASGDRLVALTPELVALGAEFGTVRAVAEMQEAFLRLLGPHEVDWEVRSEAFETLIARLESIVLHPQEASGSLASRCRAAASLLGWLAELPSRAGMEQLRDHWHEILPWVMAAAERLPPMAELYLRYPKGARICCETLGRRQPDPAACAWIEGLLAPRWLRSRSATPWRRPAEDLLARWSWLKDRQKPAVAVCLATAGQRLGRAEALLRSPADVSSQLERRALIPLLAADAPGMVVELLRGLLTAVRDRDCIRLLRHGWADAELAEELQAAVENERLELQAEVWYLSDSSPAGDRKPWLCALADLAAGGEIDPLDPPSLTLCRRLAEVGESGRPVLARLVVGALGRGGKAAAERVIRLWLRCFLGPPGPRRNAERETAVAEAIGGARSLPEGADAGSG